jgi:GNAT superfamily N-acetyltransferase
MNYTMGIEKLSEIYKELEPICREHYAEMSERLHNEGVDVSEYNPRLSQYFEAGDGGWLLTFVLRHEGVICGYSNIWVTNDMHNGDLIAQEDVLFVTKSHRNGIGKTFTKFGLEELKQRGIKRFSVSAVTDLRVAKLWKRMGFKEIATQMMYTF